MIGWSRKHEKCRECGTADKDTRPHMAFGLCKICYHRKRYEPFRKGSTRGRKRKYT